MTRINPWFRYAEDDKATLERLDGSGLNRPICFHAQQLVEKLLKGLIFETGEKVPRTHDLKALFLQAETLEPIPGEDLEFLSGVYVEARYPPDFGLLPTGEPDEDDAARAINIAFSLYGTVRR